MKRGAAGIKGIARLWAEMDDDRSRTITKEEFQRGVLNHNITVTPEDVDKLFQLFDDDGSGNISYDEFINDLRPPMNEYRVKLIKQAFAKLDKTGDGKVTPDDLKGVYNVRKHPKYLNGEWTEEQIFKKFLDNFEISQHKDGIVTLDEFILYYAGVSASIDSDAYFDMMMRNSWKL